MKNRYEIIIKGHLPLEWTGVFDGMQVICLSDGNTLLTGALPDQAALYGVLLRLRDLGLPLVSVNPIFLEGSETNEISSGHDHLCYSHLLLTA